MDISWIPWAGDQTPLAIQSIPWGNIEFHRKDHWTLAEFEHHVTFNESQKGKQMKAIRNPMASVGHPMKSKGNQMPQRSP